MGNRVRGGRLGEEDVKMEEQRKSSRGGEGAEKEQGERSRRMMGNTERGGGLGVEDRRSREKGGGRQGKGQGEGKRRRR